jgi:glucosamine-6-phosphate deaminase
MTSTPLLVFESPSEAGGVVAWDILGRIDQRRRAGGAFLLGCPTGRTPRPVFEAMARQLARTQQDISNLVLVMMDEYLVERDRDLEYADATRPWSCHHFARVEIVDRLNEGLPAGRGVPPDSVWFPDAVNPAGYDERIAAAGGIDFFLLASGASDGHVGFNQPGSARDTRTRVVPLSDDTRRDNLRTFPSFGGLSAVPRHGVTVGIATIAEAKGACMLVWGAGKRLTLARMRKAEHYEAAWPATVIHECAQRAIVADGEAVG